MEFTIARDIFSRALQRVQGIVEKRNTMPILSNVLIETDSDGICITATDLEVGMRCSYPAQVSRGGRITVSAKKLYEIIKEVAQEEVRFTTRDNERVEISCGKARFTIVGLSPDDYPFFPSVDHGSFLTIRSDLLNEMIEKTAYAICHDETKYNLNGIFFKAVDSDDRKVLRMVATDGHRLSMAEREFSGEMAEQLAKGVIFPKKGILELKKLSEESGTDIQVGFMDNSAVIKRDGMVVVMRLVDGEFPDYTRVIPQHNDRIIFINRDAFFHALKRMSILSSEKSKGVRFETQDGVMLVSSSNPELGEACEELDIEYQGERISAGFNARYLLDVLSVTADGTVQLKLRDELSPAVVTPENESQFLAVIMPMRL